MSPERPSPLASAAWRIVPRASLVAMGSVLTLKLAAGMLLGGAAVAAAQVPLIAPSPVPSALTVQVAPAGTMPKSSGANVASPQPYGSDELFLISHAPTAVFSFDVRDGAITQIYGSSQTPAGVTPTGTFALMNVAGDPDASKIYMVLTSTTVPDGIPTRALPDPDADASGGREDFSYIDTFDPDNGFGNSVGGSGPLLNRNIYDIDAPNYLLFGTAIPYEVVHQVFFEWDYTDGALSDPRPFLALEAQEAHVGGGMIVTPDGRLAYATGDSLPFGMDGRRAPQDDASHLGKLLLIDPSTGGVEVAAKGLRNVQHMQSTDEPSGIALTDIGGVTAEEVNFISWADTLDSSTIENFGWGRNADGKAREGTFYVGEGVPFKLGDEPAAAEAAPVPEPGFRQPLAQYGRGEQAPFSFVAASGPVVSDRSFQQVSLVLGDLPSGEVYATTAALTGTDVPLYRVNLVDPDGEPLGPTNSLNDLAGGRSDPRFFLFPGGSAGVLLEATGAFYSLDEPSAQAAARSPSVSCTPSAPVPDGSVTCSVTGGDAGIDILWRAAYNPVFVEAGVTLDGSGSGEFSFTVPAAAVGEELTVELVEWLAPVSLGVVGGPVPSSVPSGLAPPFGFTGDGSAIAVTLVVAALALRRRRVRASD